MIDRSQENLSRQYLGSIAKQYENNRKSSERWKRENVVFQSLLEKIKPATILDCPVGTCRWAKEYAILDAYLRGFDISADMLAEARANASLAGLTKFDFEQRDLYDPNVFAGLPNFDLVVCIRFMNWLRFADAGRILRNLAMVKSPSFVIGATVLPEQWSAWAKAKSRIRLGLDNNRRRHKQKALKYLHPEKGIEELFTSYGMKIASKNTIINTGKGINYIYLLERF